MAGLRLGILLTDGEVVGVAVRVVPQRVLRSILNITLEVSEKKGVKGTKTFVS